MISAQDDFMNRDLPADTDFDDEDAVYGTHFGILWTNDDAYEWRKLLEFYRSSGKAERHTINNVFVYLVGYTLPTIVDQANGRPPA